MRLQKLTLLWMLEDTRKSTEERKTNRPQKEKGKRRRKRKEKEMKKPNRSRS